MIEHLTLLGVLNKEVLEEKCRSYADENIKKESPISPINETGWKTFSSVFFKVI